MLGRAILSVLLLAGEGTAMAEALTPAVAEAEVPAAAPTAEAPTLAAPTVAAPTAKEWGAVRAPSSGPARAIGRYGGGCLTGAERLPEHGDGYFVTRPERGRVFGHPAIIAFIKALGARLVAAGLAPLPIGDVAQPRGGPAPSGHASHQTGLDVDVWYEAPRPDGPVALVDLAKKRLTARYGPAVARVLELVVRDARVDRLFVNPLIKQALCAQAGEHSAWLHKVRPWWGHHDHFHVRLACPSDSPACEAQAPLPDGDGCGELAWWLRDSVDRAKERKSYQSRVGATPPLPAPCLELVAAP